MEAEEQLALLVQLAGDCGLEVRELGSGRLREEWAVEGGICRVRGAWWVLLSAEDPVEDRIALVSRALVLHGGEALDAHFLPPVIRACLDAARNPAEDA